MKNQFVILNFQGSTDALAMTSSMRVALRDLRLDSLDVIHGGTDTYSLAERTRAVALRRVFEDIDPVRKSRRPGKRQPSG